MAKIGDITKWLISVRGDEGQVRSIVKLCRAEGLFSASGRGRGSPDMTSSDFATAIACALATGMTTHVPAQVRDTLALPLLTFAVDPADGGSFRDLAFDEVPQTVLEPDIFGNAKLPPEIPQLPATLGEAFSTWASHFMKYSERGVMLYDKITLRMASQSRADLELFNPKWKHTSPGWGNEEGDYEAYAWMLRFEAEGSKCDYMRREVVARLGSDALRALAEIAGGANATS